jgi:hypothetical protein
MLLAPDDAELFFKLHRSLMFFVNVWRTAQTNGSVHSAAIGVTAS